MRALKPGTSLIKVNLRHRPHPRPPEPAPDDGSLRVMRLVFCDGPSNRT